MRYLYYCNSAYQLVNILNLNWHRKYDNFENINNYESDLILLNAFNGAKEIVEILKKENSFSNVYIIERFKNEGLLHSISSFMDIIIPNRYINKSGILDNLSNKYDYLVVPKVSKITLSIWLLNKKAKIQLFEEGMGTYYGGKHMCYEYGTHQDLYQKLNGNKQFSDYEAVYLNDSRLYQDSDIDKVIEIPKYNKKYLEELKDKFSNVAFKDTNKNIYWIGQYLIGVNSGDNINETITNCLDKHKKDVIFCPHPRIKIDIDESIEKLEFNKIWELSLLNINNIENKCFLSIYSTAIFSAKLLYDQEPYMILTIKLLKNEENEHFKTMENIIELFKKTYRNPEKIMMPETIEELKGCITKYEALIK